MDSLLQLYTDYLEVQALHAFKLGLCLKTNKGDLPTDQANAIYDNARNAVINKKKAELSKKKGDF